MTAPVFVDTNVLVYAHDRSSPSKQQQAQQVVRACWTAQNGCLSLQVLQEFYVTVTRKIQPPLPLPLARELVGLYSRWRVAVIGPKELLEACEVQERHSLSFWDALIFCSARMIGAEQLYSEDFQHGQELLGIRICNPFVETKG